MVYDTNAYLTQSEMTVNAQFILDFFISQGWTKSAICAMLGNMQTESTINFGIYESLDNTSTTNGFGLVQWTPNTKYFDWANANGYSGDHVNGELNRIIYELNNGVQWISTSAYNMTFKQFTQSNETPEYLAYAWLYDYERPSSLNQPSRQTQARKWYDLLNGKTKNSLINLLLCDTLNGWKW